MTKNNEKLLVAALAGIIIVGAAAFAIQPALATSPVPRLAAPIAAPSIDILTLRLSPGA